MHPIWKFAIAGLANSACTVVSIFSGAAGVSFAQGFNTEAIAEYAEKVFNRIDLDHDGRLTRLEHHVTRGGGFMSDYQLLDLNADGVVTKDEYVNAVRKYHAPSGPRKLI